MSKNDQPITTRSESDWQIQLNKKNSTIELLERELKIEAALEKVRVRTMEMQRSNELAEVALSLFQQVKELGIEAWAAGFNIWSADNASYIDWITGPTGDFMEPYTVDVTKHPVFRAVREARERGDDFFVSFIEGEQIKEVYEYLNSFASRGQFQKILDVGIEFPTKQYNYFVFGAQVSLIFVTYEPCPEGSAIFKRFGKVFEQTYTRFLDLQNAEAQTRASQIELGLERVRSRAMAMQNSNELADIVDTVFTELTKLDMQLDRCTIMIYDPATNGSTWWMANPEPEAVPVGIFIKYHEHKAYLDILNAWNARTLKWQYALEGSNKRDWDAYLFNETDLSRLPETVIAGMKSFDRIFLNMSFNNFGSLIMTSAEPLQDDNFDILLRFGKVFDSTYTRFNDLKNAEAQARESQIEAALERVRSRSMGMQKTDELKEVIQIIFTQLQYLNIQVDQAGFVLDHKEGEGWNIWIADQIGIPSKSYIPYFDSPQWNRFIEARQKGQDSFISSLTSFEEKNQFFQKIFKYVSGVSEEIKTFVYGTPGLATSNALLKYVCLFINNFSGIEYSHEENAILMRFARVFEQTYIRFKDLKQAEEQAMEATKRASVDRIRAEIASMRTTTDLERITPLIWNELTTIGVPFIRCGVFIMDEVQQQVNTFLSTPGGKGIAASFHLPYNANQETVQIVAHWNRKEIYRPHWDEAAFIDFTRVLAERGAVTTGETFLVENRPTDLYLHFIPFLQGMLYVGDTSPLSEEHLQLVQALAEAFSTAYARYEDFNKLEFAKVQIEKTLVDLKQAQSQLVQAEKMASLGELTAGIAHEIQNPLNFVNNFSEVNQELIAELREELGKGNMEAVANMATQIRDNEVKILHHGKRADAIVKSMLQHSRISTSTTEPTDINALADEYFRLAYHGMRAKDKSFQTSMQTDYDGSIGRIPLIPQDFGRVLLNLYNNAFYAVDEKRKTSGKTYEPVVSISTKKIDGRVRVSVKDNGNGISSKVVDKIFQPFFTTKPTGHGTGLGLSLSYDIIKAHGGEIEVDTKEKEFTELIIWLNT